MGRSVGEGDEGGGAAEALAQAKATLDSVEEIAQIGHYEWDLATRKAFWSKQMYLMLGYQPGQVEPGQEAWMAALHPADRELARTRLERDLQTATDEAYVYRVVWPSGELRHIRASARVERDAGGRPTRLFGTMLDVTDRVQVETSLRDAKFTLEVAQGLADIGSWVYDLPSGKLSWSDQLYRIHGYSPGAFTPDPESDRRLVHPDDGDVLGRMYAQIYAGELGQPLTYRIVRPSGEVRSVIGRMTLQRDQAGLPTRLVGTVLDVTDRRRLEDAVSQSQRMEAVGRLAGGIAHDFNNLLASIVLNSAIGQRSVKGEPRLAQALREIDTAAGRAGELTKQLLAFARQQPVAASVVAPGLLVRELEGIIKRLLGERITLEVVIPDELGNVKVDSSQLQQVLVNLVVNARDAMRKGGALRLSLANALVDKEQAETRPNANAGSYVMLEVADTGAGIAPDVLPHIFEPFFTTKRAGEGHGLGLATSYGIVRQAGGHITVESEVGTGTAFRIYLPRTMERLAVAPSRREAAPSRGRETVLLVEDDDAVRSAMVQTLEGLGYVVLCAASAGDAMALAEAGRLHLLLTDVVMPGMTGPQLAREVTKRHRHVKVLLVSGFAPAHLDDSDPVGDTDWPLLTKPFTPTELGRKVREVLDGR